jgi:sulfotransferase family protein
MFPFFIVGNPRSGTSLLRLMLNSHPLISVPPECGFAVWLYEKYKGKCFLDKKIAQSYIDDVVQSRKFETWGVGKDAIEGFIFSQQCEQYKEIASFVYFVYAQKNSKNPVLVGDKNNFYINHIAKIKEIFDEPKFVFIVRDGRDVACSYRELCLKNISSVYAPNLPNSIEEIANEWASNNKLITKESYERSLLVTYEDLVTHPRRTLKKICKFLGVDYDELMLEYYKNNDEPAEFLQWKSKTLEKPDGENIGKYKTVLSGDEIALFEFIAGETLDDFDYKIEKFRNH